jgi:hypothetical protein
MPKVLHGLFRSQEVVKNNAYGRDNVLYCMIILTIFDAWPDKQESLVGIVARIFKLRDFVRGDVRKVYRRKAREKVSVRKCVDIARLNSPRHIQGT